MYQDWIYLPTVAKRICANICRCVPQPFHISTKPSSEQVSLPQPIEEKENKVNINKLNFFFKGCAHQYQIMSSVSMCDSTAVLCLLVHYAFVPTKWCISSRTSCYACMCKIWSLTRLCVVISLVRSFRHFSSCLFLALCLRPFLFNSLFWSFSLFCLSHSVFCVSCSVSLVHKHTRTHTVVTIGSVPGYRHMQSAVRFKASYQTFVVVINSLHKLKLYLRVY